MSTAISTGGNDKRVGPTLRRKKDLPKKRRGREEYAPRVVRILSPERNFRLEQKRNSVRVLDCNLRADISPNAKTCAFRRAHYGGERSNKYGPTDKVGWGNLQTYEAPANKKGGG